MNKYAVKLVMGIGMCTSLGIGPGLAQTSKGASASATVAVDAPSGPKIKFAETKFDFGKIDSGLVVTHDFVFTNTGSGTLEIKDVRPGCGCTTAGAWDKSVEPGKTGVIPLQFNSTFFSGSVNKSATVACNDASQSNIFLEITGTVWKPIDVTPSIAVFTTTTEVQTNETRLVRIVSNLEEPIELSDLECTNRSFQTELKTVKPGKEFELRISTVPPFATGLIDGTVTLKTSAEKMPTIKVSAHVSVQQPVIVIPNHIMLPAGPLTNTTQRILTIQNNGTNVLVLSEPHSSVPGVEVAVKELRPGRQFSLIVDFPAGFQAKTGQDVEVTVKSDHPKFPLISVHVFQPQPQPSRSAAAQPQTPSATVAPQSRSLPAPPVVPARPASSAATGR